MLSIGISECPGDEPLRQRLGRPEFRPFGLNLPLESTPVLTGQALAAPERKPPALFLNHPRLLVLRQPPKAFRKLSASRDLYTFRSKSFGSMRTNFTSSGVREYSSESISEFTAVVLPCLVAPAIRMCGAFARSMTFGIPCAPRPMATGSAAHRQGLPYTSLSSLFKRFASMVMFDTAEFSEMEVTVLDILAKCVYLHKRCLKNVINIQFN